MRSIALAVCLTFFAQVASAQSAPEKSDSGGLLVLGGIAVEVAGLAGLVFAFGEISDDFQSKPFFGSPTQPRDDFNNTEQVVLLGSLLAMVGGVVMIVGGASMIGEPTPNGLQLRF